MTDETAKSGDIWQIKMSIDWRSPWVLGILALSIVALLAAEIVLLLVFDIIGATIEALGATKPIEGWIALIPFVIAGIWIGIESRSSKSRFKSWIVAFPPMFVVWVICVVLSPAVTVWLWWSTLGEIVMPERMLPLLMVVGTGALYVWVGLYNLFVLPDGPPANPAAVKPAKQAAADAPVDQAAEDPVDRPTEDPMDQPAAP